MASFENLEDDVPELAQAAVASLEDDVELPEAGAPAVRAAAATPATGPVKKRLKAAAEGDKDAKKRKRDKGDKGEKGDKKDKKKGSKTKAGDGEQRPARPQRPQRAPGADASEPPRRPRGEDDGPENSVDSQEVQATAADEAFIDDEGAEGPEEEFESEGADEEATRLAAAPEATEHDEIDELLNGKKKRKRKDAETDQQMEAVVNHLISSMEAAAEKDYEDHDAHKPAVAKLKELNHVEYGLAQHKYHEMFIQRGGLGVLKAWLEPYADGRLPNSRIRAAILKICKDLALDTGDDEIRESLKKSQLGSRVLFLSKCVDENTANRKLARELVSAWSAPILHDNNVEAEKKRVREEALRAARAAALEQQRAREAEEAGRARPGNLKPGQAGYRWHASIPTTLKLDYVVQPETGGGDVRDSAPRPTTGGKKDDDRMTKKMREVQRKLKGSTARAAAVSVEGRNIVLMN